MPYSKHSRRVGETAQQVKVLTAKPDDLSLTPGTHMVEKTDTHNSHTVVCVSIHKQMWRGFGGSVFNPLRNTQKLVVVVYT